MPLKSGRKRTVRVQRLLDGELIDLIQQGISIPQISKDKHVDPSTIYGLLEKVAKENGYKSRDELLLQPHSTRTTSMSRAEIEREYVNLEEMDRLYKEVDKLMSEIISTMKKNIEEDFA